MSAVVVSSIAMNIAIQIFRMPLAFSAIIVALDSRHRKFSSKLTSLNSSSENFQHCGTLSIIAQVGAFLGLSMSCEYLICGFPKFHQPVYLAVHLTEVLGTERIISKTRPAGRPIANGWLKSKSSR